MVYKVYGSKILKFNIDMSFLKRVGFRLCRFLFKIVGIKYFKSDNEDYYQIRP